MNKERILVLSSIIVNLILYIKIFILDFYYFEVDAEDSLFYKYVIEDLFLDLLPNKIEKIIEIPFNIIYGLVLIYIFYIIFYRRREIYLFYKKYILKIFNKI